MLETFPAEVVFTLDKSERTLSRANLESRLRGVVPETRSKHFVRINATWYPVVQALEAGLGVPRGRFRSSSARRHLAALGFELRGERKPREPVRNTQDDAMDATGLAVGTVPAPRTVAKSHTSPADETWHKEENVQAALVRFLVADGWTILREANTASREHGIDVVAEFDGATYGIEVKGFPSRGYADPRRAAEIKRTSPSTQAGHWYSQAILAATRLRGKQPDMRSVIALPNFPRYRTLVDQTRGSMDAAGIEVWWVDEFGRVTKR
jgi:Holliday junction resolvase-like predicted endonuclease